ncbi:hypothetical protein CCUS01_14900 [Colletotrichum cuscutae]|uniref:Uncharacterized protein n=1 Tax=Colletotrichum cuscutae TaxID=1209917 RepID=A0AAI9VFL9_9PEZI|nr:hypothetical protein CCUS01_14900 [Colletotrichum cuscutae]
MSYPANSNIGRKTCTTSPENGLAAFLCFSACTQLALPPPLSSTLTISGTRPSQQLLQAPATWKGTARTGHRPKMVGITASPSAGTAAAAAAAAAADVLAKVWKRE